MQLDGLIWYNGRMEGLGEVNYACTKDIIGVSHQFYLNATSQRFPFASTTCRRVRKRNSLPLTYERRNMEVATDLTRAGRRFLRDKTLPPSATHFRGQAVLGVYNTRLLCIVLEDFYILRTAINGWDFDRERRSEE
jgi:hypothetical protein